MPQRRGGAARRAWKVAESVISEIYRRIFVVIRFSAIGPLSLLSKLHTAIFESPVGSIIRRRTYETVYEASSRSAAVARRKAADGNHQKEHPSSLKHKFGLQTSSVQLPAQPCSTTSYIITVMQGFSYGICPCKGVFDSRTVEVRMNVGGSTVLLTDVPQGACPVCGSRVYKEEVLELLECLMKSARSGPATTS